MSLRELYELLEGIALRVPDVRMCVRNDVLRLNECREAEYGVFAITQNEHRYRLDEDRVVFSLNLFYIDRLTNDQANELEVQSHGIEVLRSVLQRAEDDERISVSECSFTSFTERFQDLCAGVWCRVDISVPISDCLLIDL